MTTLSVMNKFAVLQRVMQKMAKLSNPISLLDDVLQTAKPNHASLLDDVLQTAKPNHASLLDDVLQTAKPNHASLLDDVLQTAKPNHASLLDDVVLAAKPKGKLRRIGDWLTTPSASRGYTARALGGGGVLAGGIYGAYALTQSKNPTLQQAGLETIKQVEEADIALEAAKKSGNPDAIAAANKLAENAKLNLVAANKLVAEKGEYKDLVSATGLGDFGQGALTGLGEPLITTPVGAGIGYGISELTDTNPLLGGGIGAIAGAVTPNITDAILRKYLGG